MKADHTVHVDALTFVDHAAHGDVARAVAGVFHHVGADGLLSAFLEAQRRSAVLYAAEKSAHHTTGDAAHPVFKYGEAAHAVCLLQVDGMLDKAHKTAFINHTASHIGLKGGLFFSGRECKGTVAAGGLVCSVMGLVCSAAARPHNHSTHSLSHRLQI